MSGKSEKSKKDKVRASLLFREFDDPLHYFSDAEQLEKSFIEIFSAIGSNPTGDEALCFTQFSLSRLIDDAA